MGRIIDTLRNSPVCLTWGRLRYRNQKTMAPFCSVLTNWESILRLPRYKAIGKASVHEEPTSPGIVICYSQDLLFPFPSILTHNFPNRNEVDISRGQKVKTLTAQDNWQIKLFRFSECVIQYTTVVGYQTCYLRIYSRRWSIRCF